MKVRTAVSCMALSLAMPLAAQAPATPSAATQQATDWRETYAYNVGMEAVVFGYPIVKNVAVRFAQVENIAGAVKTPLNQWFHVRRASDETDKVHSSVTADLLYSVAWFDLRKEPVVVTVPDSPGTYYSVQFMEMYSDIFAYLGTRQTGGKAGSYLLVGPGWTGETPAGIAGVIHSPTPTGMLLLRTGFADRTKLEEAFSIQDGNRVAPLAKWLAGDTSPGSDHDVIDPAAPGSSPLPFFVSLNRGITENPPPARDAGIVAQLASVGLGPNQSDDFSKLDPATRKGLQRAMIDGLALLRQVSVAGGNAKKVNGWAYGQKDWGRTAERGDYLTRSANQSFSGMQEHWIEEVVKLRAHHDGDGDLLDGAKHGYTLHFSADQIPEARAFWSVTVYDSDYDLVGNPIHRFALGSLDKTMRRDKDGGLTIYLQADPPAKKLTANWLPVPKGPFNLFLRAYLPGEALQKQDYVPPAVRKMP